jgi:lycopene beta-cyclase
MPARGVAVVGAGPAGSALAAACAERGLPTTLVDPRPDAAWTATYGAWVDELPALPASLWSHRFPRPLVGVDAGPPIALPRPYGLLANEALRGHLRQRLLDAGGTVVTGRADHVDHGAASSVLRLSDGRTLAAAVVVDASGHRAALVPRAPGRPPAWQVAHGVVARLRRPLLPSGGMWFMDWRRPGVEGDDRTPTFLYAMDLGDGRVLVEETSLAARPPLRIGELETRLEARLQAAGAPVVAVEATERVAFPMGGPVPDRTGRTVAFGAAAGAVHPATGYQVAASLRAAERVAEAIAGAADGRPAAVSRAAWSAVWPPDALRQRALHAAGLEVLLSLGTAEVQRFFGAFFSLPTPVWMRYVSGARSSGELAATMLAVVRRLPPQLALRVAGGALRAEGAALLGAAGGLRSDGGAARPPRGRRTATRAGGDTGA